MNSPILPESLPESLPVMQSWHCLLLPKTVEETSDGGIILTQETNDIRQYGQYVCQIVAVGPLFFKNPKLRSEGDEDIIPKVGDWVLVNRMNGQRITYGPDKVELRMTSDDSIICVLPSGPDGYRVGL